MCKVTIYSQDVRNEREKKNMQNTIYLQSFLRNARQSCLWSATICSLHPQSLFVITSASLSISIASIHGILTDHSSRPSVSLSVCLSVRWVICEKMADWIGMLFGVVSGVGWGMDVLDESPRASRWRVASWGFRPHCFEWRILNRSVFYSCVKNWQYFRTDSVSLELTFHWLSKDTFKFQVDVGVYEKFTKM